MSAKWPRWLVANWLTMPPLLTANETLEMPAFNTRMSKGSAAVSRPNRRTASRSSSREPRAVDPLVDELSFYSFASSDVTNPHHDTRPAGGESANRAQVKGKVDGADRRVKCAQRSECALVAVLRATGPARLPAP